ncbi:MAG: DegV family protein [Bacillota bacterium]|nr:DegV family protein [Bacillota bacterium]MDW7678385.1 DegV family protein [Bacillota bacterium]
MSSIEIMTDSTAYLEESYIENHPVRVVPLSVHYNGKMEKEGLPGTFNHFFESLKTSEVFPTTSQPSAGEFLEAYQDALSQGKEIIVLTISSGISGTYHSASTAVELSGAAARISVIDSRTTAGNLNGLVQMAVNMAAEGKSRKEIVALLESQKMKSGVRLTVDTLDYLKKGGRLSNAGALIGNLLNIKPVIGLIDGTLQPVSKARGKKKAIQQMVQAVPPSSFLIHVAHVMAVDEATIVMNQLAEKFPDAEVVLFELGPVIGSHLGPGALGVLYLYK